MIFLHLCESEAASQKANISLVPPVKAAGGDEELRAFSSILHCLRRGRERAAHSLCNGNVYRRPGYRSINGTQPRISRAVRGPLKAWQCARSHDLLRWYFASPACSRRGTTGDVVLQGGYFSAGSVGWADAPQGPEVAGTKRVSEVGAQASHGQ